MHGNFCFDPFSYFCPTTASAGCISIMIVVVEVVVVVGVKYVWEYLFYINITQLYVGIIFISFFKSIGKIIMSSQRFSSMLDASV